MNTREQVVNYVRHLVDLTFLDDRVQAAPTKVQTAVSTTCNLACPFCMRESMGIRENMFMDFEHFSAHIDELKASTTISLFGLGEPFLHPEFFRFVDLCKEYRIMISTSSHGMSLDHDTRKRILESGLDDLHISMDGATKKTFEWLRKNAVFETVVEQVTALARERDEIGSKTPRMNVNLTVSRHNIREVPLLVSLAHRMGCQSASFSSVVAYKPEDEDLGVLDTPVFEKYMDRGRRVADKLKIGFSFWRQKAVGYKGALHNPGAAYGCGQLNGDQIIERDGKMKLCCYIEEDIDHVFENGPLKAFNGGPIRGARRDLMEGRVRIECLGCLYLRERTPFWIQGKLIEAGRIVEHNHLLTYEDRTELKELIEETETKKKALYPDHAFIPVAAQLNGGQGRDYEPDRDFSELPVY
jgi:MoaA/NifB/PqqE/SkfB family radical SAM enzyme